MVFYGILQNFVKAEENIFEFQIWSLEDATNTQIQLLEFLDELNNCGLIQKDI